MARTVKKFTPKSASKKAEPIVFELYDETFEALPFLQGVVILDFIAATSGSEDKSTSAITTEVMPFFESALTDESFTRFESLIRSKDRIVEFDDLMEILSWLVNEYTDRPTSGSGKVVEIVLDLWEFHDGYYLLRGVDLSDLIETLPADRILNVFETIIIEDASVNATIPEDGRNSLRKNLIVLRNGGTIDKPQPVGGQPNAPMVTPARGGGPVKGAPKYIEPLPGGYPGLEPPLG